MKERTKSKVFKVLALSCVLAMAGSVFDRLRKPETGKGGSKRIFDCFRFISTAAPGTAGS